MRHRIARPPRTARTGPLARIARVAVWAALLVAGGLGLVAGAGAQQGSGVAYSIELPGTIDPATERWIDAALNDAVDDGAELIIVRIDTPGGLDTSMREIVQDIIATPVPVVTYVVPDGARAASAGLFITQAGDVAAMSPQTNIGSATPISIGPGEQDEVLGRKIENDAAAYVRALAEGHGRNPDLAEEMVREATNVSARAALEAKLIDVVASSEAELLAEIDGFRVEGPKAGVLDTDGLRIERRDMPFQYDVLQILVNPTVAFLLLMVGLLGIGFEVFNPGLIVPGTFGAIAFLLGLYGTALLPFTAVGILLLIGGIALMIAEAHFPTSGILGVAGVVSIVLAGLLLFDTDSDEFGVSIPVVIAVGLLLGGLAAVMISKTIEAHRGRVHTGWEELVGAEGVVRMAIDPVGQVFVEGTLWRAQALGDARIEPGYRVRVESIDGLTLGVREIGGPEGPGTERTGSGADSESNEGVS